MGMIKRGRRKLMTAAAGAAAAYFMDPDRGRARRARFRDQSLAMMRRGQRRVERLQRRAAAEAYGAAQRAAHQVPANPFPDDGTLAHKIESEILGSADVPKGRINVNAVEGVVELRGEVDTPDDIRRIERQVRSVAGVVDVHNMLHLPNTPAPNKAEAREAGLHRETGFRRETG